jgi:Replication initiation factor
MYATKHIDWLSITFKTGTDLQAIFPLLDWRYSGRGRFGYKWLYKDKITGASYQEGSENDDMGVHLTLSGEALGSLRSHFGGQDNALVGLLADWHGYASRLDLTLNIHEGDLTPRKVYSAVKTGALKARTNTYRFIEGKKGNVAGDTLYLGSPKSDRQFRCYNKSAELGIVDGVSWVRLELELRALRAEAAFRSCALNSVSPTVTGHMKDFLAWPQREYQMALSGESVEPVEIPRKQSNRQRWLLGQVAQALAKEIREDVQFRSTFDTAVNEAFDLLD